MATFSDPFTGAAGDISGAGGWATIGASSHERDGSGNVRGDGSGQFAYTVQTGTALDTADHAVEFPIINLNGASFAELSLIARASTSGQNGYSLHYENFGSVDLTLYRIDSGSFTELDRATGLGTGNRAVRLEVEGTTIRGYFDGVEVVSATGQTNHSTNKNVGMEAFGTGPTATQLDAEDLSGETAPAAIDDLAGTAGDEQVVLTWTAPDDGGDAITDYDIEYRVSGETASAYGTATSENGTSLGSNNAQPLPASAASGDLIIAVIGHDNPSTTAITVSTGWTPLNPITQGTNVVKGLIAARVLDGTTGNNILSVSGATQDYVVQLIRVPSGQHGCTNADLATSLAIATAQGASGSINPASLNAGSAKDRVWFVAGILDCTTGSTISAIPANYTSVLDILSANTTSSVRIRTARRDLTATQTEDPGTFTNTSRNWIAYTIAVPPYVAPWQTFSDGTSSSTGATVTGLTNGTAYDFRVRAVNGIGDGAWSNTAGPYTPVAASGSTVIQVWDGTAFVGKPTYIYDGSALVSLDMTIA